MMLSAFEAQPIVELRKHDKAQIESILAYGDRLLVGLSSGDLRIYRVNEADRPSTADADNGGEADAQPQSPAKRPPVELLREIEKFSRKPIQQLAIIKEANVLVSLSDGFVAFHDLHTFEPTERFEQTKGATTFAVISNVIKDSSTQINSIVSRLAVVVKRKVLLWTWQDMELTDVPSELTLPANVKSLAWITATKIVVGMDPGYELVDIENQDMKDIVRPSATTEGSNAATSARFGVVNSSGMSYMGMSSWIPKPLAAKLAENEMLLARDVNSLFISNSGRAIEKRQIPWASSPEAIGYSYPYMLSLHPQSKRPLEIRNPETLSLLQSIPLAAPTLLHVPQPYISLAHAGKGFLVGSERCIWRMNAIGYDSQIKELLAQGNFDEALSLVGLLEDTLLLDKEERLRHIKVQKAQRLFNERRFRDAMDLFSDAEAPPDSVMSLYPKEIAGKYAGAAEKADDIGAADEAAESPQLGSPKKSKASGKNSTPTTPKKKMQRRDSDTDSVRTTATEHKQDNNKSGGDVPTGRELHAAVIALNGFLAQTRKQIQKYLDFDRKLKNPEDVKDDARPPFAHFVIERDQDRASDWTEKLRETAVAVDTTLFRAYMFASPSLASSLFRLDNFCDPKVVEEKLYENSRYLELIDFLGGKRLHRDALELLEKLAKDDSRDDIDKALKGPRRTVDYLKQLPFEQIDLILQFVKWPLEADAEQGMEVFIADTANAESLARDSVYDFLRSFDVDLAVRYLEHVIIEWRDPTATFHEGLADAYVERLKNIPLSDAEGDKSKSLQEKLERFVVSSRHFDASGLLQAMPDDDARFFESRATLHDKLSEHLEALEIYVFKTRSPAKAEAYCNATHLKKTPENTFDSDPADSIYAKLLSLYLAPPKPHEPNHVAALDLLSRHGSRIPALSLLEFLPPHLSVDKVESYFRGRMRAANTVAREAAIVRALSSVEKSLAEVRLRVGTDEEDEEERRQEAIGGWIGKGQNRRVVISEERLCPACNKRFGRAAVRVWPSGEVRHYGCGEPRSIGGTGPQQAGRIIAR